MDLNLARISRKDNWSDRWIRFNENQRLFRLSPFTQLYILTRKLVPLMQSYVRSYVHAHVRTHVGRTHTRRFWSSLIDCVRITLTRACVLSNSRFFLSTIIENVGINQIRNTPTNIYDIFVSHAAISHLFSTFFHSLTTFHAF